MPILRADGSSESVVEELPVAEDVEPDDEAVDAAEDAVEEADAAVVLPDDPLLLVVLLLLLPVLLLVESLSVTGGGTYAIDRISMAILRISARANCDRSISSRPRDVIFHD
ncbi:MAG: hypothetical protein JWP89_3720 [Schlesneria sp.]|nr:hypothetical protein [Schlesneria sp.]